MWTSSPMVAHMRRVSIRAVRVGMTLGQDVRNFHGQVLLRAGVSIDEAHVKTFKAWGIESLDVMDADEGHPVSPAAVEPLLDAAAVVRRVLQRSDLGHPLVAEIGRIVSVRRAGRGAGA